MGKLVHTSRSRVIREGGPIRRASFEGLPGEYYYGMHGGYKKFYGVEMEKEYPATLDFVVNATGA